MLKCTVSGFINETVIDTSENITKYLQWLKQLQEQNIGIDSIKVYNQKAKIQKRQKEDAERRRRSFTILPITTSDIQHDFPLSIKIEPVKMNDEYFWCPPFLHHLPYNRFSL